jgi:hypothetical protein
MLMREKKYLYIFTLLTLLFVGFHFIIWNLFTKELFTYKDNMRVGDLGRMSYLTKSLTVRKINESNLSSKHIKYTNDVTSIDVITIGDSFSNGGGGGINRYYQDFIETKQNLKVMNIQQGGKGFIETALLLDESGILDTLKPSVIILETIERHAIQRYSKKINWNVKLSPYSLVFLDEKGERSELPSPSFINNLNYNALLYNILYNYDENAVFSKVYIANLSKNLFSNHTNRLLFYYNDLKYIPLSNDESIALLNDNLNNLQKILDKKNIQLYFMPAVDKYNLYSEYIQNNNYPKSTFFERLRPLKKNYKWIDTKMILSEMLKNDIKDVYYSDDTHWSSKASEEIFKKIKLK